LRAGLAVSTDPRGIVVGCAGDQSGAELLQRIAKAKRPGGLGLRGLLVAAGMLVRVMLRIRLVALCHTGSSRRDNEPDGSRFRAATLPDRCRADKHYAITTGSMAVATPGSRMRKRDPNPSVSKVARRSPAFWRKCPQPSVCTGPITASAKARAVSTVSLVSMVGWNGPRVWAAPANGSTTPALNRR